VKYVIYDCFVLTETQSQKSSRVPSPVGTQKYDDMEGQFVANTPSGKLSFVYVNSCHFAFLVVLYCTIAVVVPRVQQLPFSF